MVVGLELLLLSFLLRADYEWMDYGWSMDCMDVYCGASAFGADHGPEGFLYEVIAERSLFGMWYMNFPSWKGNKLKHSSCIHCHSSRSGPSPLRSGTQDAETTRVPSRPEDDPASNRGHGAVRRTRLETKDPIDRLQRFVSFFAFRCPAAHVQQKPQYCPVARSSWRILESQRLLRRVETDRLDVSTLVGVECRVLRGHVTCERKTRPPR